MIPINLYKSRIIIGITLAVMLTTWPVVSTAIPWDTMIYPLSIRSAGMGETGNADFLELANLTYNPANTALMNSIQLNWTWSEVSFLLADIKLDGALAGGGYQRRLSESFSVGGGLAFGYAKESLGFKGFDDAPPEWGAYNQVYTVSTGVACRYRDRVSLGIGLNFKDWKYDNDADDDFNRQILEAAVFDAGLSVVATLLRRNDYHLTLAAAFAYNNFGGSVKTIQTRVFLPPSSSSGDAPQYRRYGLNIQFDSPSWSRANSLYETKLPVLSAAFNYDITEYANFDFENPRHFMGGEIGFFRMLFLRAGRISQKEWDYTWRYNERTKVDTTWGFGIAVPFRQYIFRFDYAQRRFDESDVKMNRYALFFETFF